MGSENEVGRVQIGKLSISFQPVPYLSRIEALSQMAGSRWW
ncbi:MAG: hypothetical protein JWM58_4399 [Rhizobium sp.]|nr:hypothetical protein [Rhizobium sp.]